jgi:hypothetical protein
LPLVQIPGAQSQGQNQRGLGEIDGLQGMLSCAGLQVIGFIAPCVTCLLQASEATLLNFDRQGNVISVSISLSTTCVFFVNRLCVILSQEQEIPADLLQKGDIVKVCSLAMGGFTLSEP